MAESELYGDPSKIFTGIRFVLAGFDSPMKEQVLPEAPVTVIRFSSS